MSWYAEIPSLRRRQLLHDAAVPIWGLEWFRVGLAVHSAVHALGAPGREAAGAGDGLSDSLGQAAKRAGDIPLVGGGLQAPLASLLARGGGPAAD